jgi:translation initiation factor 1
MRNSRNRSDGVVYSSGPGGSGNVSRCPKCGWPLDSSAASPAACACSKPDVSPRAARRVRVSRSSAGRAGKTVTVIAGLEESDAVLAALAKKLKARCGAGGTIKDGRIEIQGDHVETLLSLLTGEGFRPKKSGG